jgi:hypothetical protein
MSQERAQTGAVSKAKIMAMAILGAAQNAYQAAREVTGVMEAKAHRRTFGGGRSGGYINPADFYGHGSRTFLKNKRRGQ